MMLVDWLKVGGIVSLVIYAALFVLAYQRKNGLTWSIFKFWLFSNVIYRAIAVFILFDASWKMRQQAIGMILFLEVFDAALTAVLAASMVRKE